jgi:phytoene synthase
MEDMVLLQQLRQADADRYLSVLYAPADLRGDLAALYAFNAEIASVRDRISQPLPGEVRLQWWRDLIEGGGEEGGSPVAAGLLQAVARHRLPHEPLLGMLEARIFDLYDDPMPSVADLEGYAGETASALIQLASLILAPARAAGFAEAAGHAGCAQAIAGILRSLPLHRARGQCYVPRDILEAAGLSRDDLLAGDDKAALGRAVSAMVALGRQHFAAFATAAKGMPSPLRPAYLPAGLARAYLDSIERQGIAAMDRIADISPISRNMIMVRRAFTGW